MKRIIIMALGVLLALALATPMALAQVEQGANKSGKAAELAEAWTQWAYSKDVNVDSPLIGGDPDYSQARCDGTPVGATQGKQWFLAGTVGTAGSSVEETVRTCTVPVGTHFFFPVVSSLAFPFFVNADPPETPENQREAAIAFIETVLDDPDFSMSVTVDGKEVKSNRIVRAVSEPYFTLSLPEENVFDCPQCEPEPFDVPAGEYEGATADGLWVTLPPLPPGEHEIHFEFSAPNVDLNPNNPGPEGVSQNNTYNLTVVNKGKKPAR